jgi:uncharacterized protein (UPF0261 family)
MTVKTPKILVIGTGDTKSDELSFMRECIEGAGGVVVMMDVSVLGDPKFTPDYSKHDVAQAAGTTIEGVINSGDENSAMALMAAGASKLARHLYDEGKADAALILGGSMGTDLALDVAAALPLGVPKFVVSTISFSHLIPPDRISTDLMMILWAGGLYGLNSICKSVLSQACGAVVGAARSSVKPQAGKPIIGMTSLGKSCLKYMVPLKPALEARGYEVAVFHTTGMGGRAFESVAAQNGFAAVMDFSLQEIVNHDNGVLATSSGWDRLENAAKAGIPQIVAPGAIDMVDVQSWAPLPAHFADRPYHAHNRLIGSFTTDLEGRRQTARTIGQKLERAWGPVAFILPSGGVEQWDQEGEPLHDPEGLRAFNEAMRLAVRPPAEFHEIPDHINSPAFAAKALEVFDAWVADDIIPAGVK